MTSALPEVKKAYLSSKRQRAALLARLNRARKAVERARSVFWDGHHSDADWEKLMFTEAEFRQAGYDLEASAFVMSDAAGELLDEMSKR